MLSFYTPLILGHFVYINAQALPEFDKTIWTTSLNYQEAITPPAVLFINFSNLTVSQASFDSLANGTCNGPTGNCNANMKWEQAYPGIEYAIFQPEDIVLRAQDDVELNFWVTWNSSHGVVEPYLYYALIDPTLTDNLTDILHSVGSGDCSFLTGQYVPVLGTNYLWIERMDFDDKRGDLTNGRNASKCSLSARQFPSYSTYRSTITHFDLNDKSTCDYASSKYKDVACESNNFIRFSSNMINMQTSGRGSSWLKMLTDEGAIVGGVMFFTYFIGVYVI